MSRKNDWWLCVLLLIVGCLVVACLLFVLPVFSPPNNVDCFNKTINSIIVTQPISPLVVTIYELPRDNANTSTADLLVDKSKSADTDNVIDINYDERLIVVKPHNWFVYTNNGLNFYFISNNLSNRTARCDLDRQLIAVDFRLLTLSESAMEPTTTSMDKSGRLKVACINSTYDTLIRRFGVGNANKTYIDLSNYFDKNKNSDAPMLIVDNVINYLLQHNLV